MNVLFVTAAPPWPAWGGAAMRAYHFMRLLGPKHRVHLICPGTVREELQLKDALGPWAQGVFCVPYGQTATTAQRAAAVATSWLPDVAVRMRQPGLGMAVREQARARRVDLVHIVGLEAAASVFPEGMDDVPLVLDALNAEYLLQERASQTALREGGWTRAAYSWLQARKLAQYEESVGRQMAGLIATSLEDRNALERVMPGVPSVVVANGVDTDEYCAASCPPLEKDAPTLLFTGTMDYRPNIDAAVWFADQILPRIRMHLPGAQFVVMGKDPVPEVRQLASPHVKVTGMVNSDLPYFHRASVFVLPMRFGGGTRLKLLQAMSCALPIVTTSMGASGADFEHGVDGLVADDADAFAQAVITMLENADLAKLLGAHARASAMTSDWKLRTPLLESFYLDVLTHVDTAPVRRRR